MEKVAVEEVDPSELNPALRVLTDGLGATDVAVNRYDVEPGGRISGGYHTHHDQEEVFVVLSGAATFETGGGDVRVRAGEAVRFAPGEFHHAYAPAEDPAVVLAVGAPPASREVESVRRCTTCEAVFHHRRASFLGAGDGGDGPTRRVECPRCGSETRRTGRPD